MPEVEKHEIEVPEMKTGSVEILTKQAFKNPAPAKLTLIVDVVRNFSITLIGLVTATTIFSGNEAKVICFSLAVLCGLCEAIKKATGVVSE